MTYLTPDVAFMPPALRPAPRFLRRGIDADRTDGLDGPIYVYTFAWEGREYEVDEFGNLLTIDGLEFRLFLEESHPLREAMETEACR